VKLTDTEKAMLDGREGRAKAKAMDLLVRYGEALGAERLVETKNVAGTWAVSRFMTDFIARGLDAVYSEFNLDSDEVVETPHTVVSSCQLIAGVDHRNWRIQGVPEEAAEAQARAEAFFGRRGVQQFATCTPYQVGLLQRGAGRAHEYRGAREHRGRQHHRAHPLLGLPQPRAPRRHP
jgi:predicted aconitase